MLKPILYLVVPCYNEEEALSQSAKVFENKIMALIKSGKVNKQSRICLVDDGSKDQTWQIIDELGRNNEHFVGLKLSRNRGHQNALLAGLLTIKDEADVAISLDADLQDDINAIDEMLSEYEKGSEIVYAARKERKTDTFFKKNSALFFYKMLKMLGVECVYNHADYRLMSKRALNELANFSEVNLFLRGLVPLLGFKSSIVYYSRDERVAGESKYPLRKMLSFALTAITSFSTKPLRLITAIGFILLFTSILATIYLIIMRFLGNTPSGLTFIAVSIWFIGATQILCTGVIAEYIGKIYQESKRRPRFIVEEKVG